MSLNKRLDLEIRKNDGLRLLVHKLCQALHHSNPHLQESAKVISEAMLDTQSLDNIKSSIQNISQAINRVNKQGVIEFKTTDNSPPTESLESSLEPELALANFMRDVSNYIQSIITDLNIPDDYQNRVDEIKSQLNQAPDIVTINALLNETYDLILVTHDHHQVSFETFLANMHKNLENLFSMLNDSQSNRSQAKNNAAQMDSTVREQISSIQTSFKDDNSLEVLEKNIQSKLGTLVNEMDSFKEKEAQRLKEAEEQAQILAKKLEETESQTESLQENLKQQRSLAKTDQLTGLPNRAGYIERLSKELQNLVDPDYSIIMAVGDIDNFKNLNDTYGHLAGDKVLAQVAKVISNGLPEGAFAARYGGEEFIILLPKFTIAAAKDILDNIRKSLEACAFHFKDKTHKITVTISFGATEFQRDIPPEVIFQNADNALYQAKKTKNQTVISQ